LPLFWRIKVPEKISETKYILISDCAYVNIAPCARSGVPEKPRS
jgi:hypothetical protein